MIRVNGGLIAADGQVAIFVLLRCWGEAIVKQSSTRGTLVESMELVKRQQHEVWQFLMKLNLDVYPLPNVSPNPLKSVYSRDTKTYAHKNPFTRMPLAALFIITQNRKRPNVHQWENG